MDSARRPILFVSLPESGLLNPLLVLAGELSRQGVEDLWFATDEPRRDEIKRIAEGSPVEFASLGEVISELSAVTWDDEVYREVTQSSRFKAHRAVVRHSYRPDAHTAKLRRLEAVVDEVRPALMVIDCMSSFAIELATSRKIPYVLSVPFVASNVLTAYTPFGKGYTPWTFPVPHTGLSARMTLKERVINELFKVRNVAMFLNPEMGKVLAEDARRRKALELPPPGPMGRIEQAELVLCNSIAELDYPFDIPEKMRLVGAMVPPLPEAPDDVELSGWLDAQSSVVYAGFGTITRLTRGQVANMVEVARRLQGRNQVLWKLPKEQQHLLPPKEQLPDNLRIESWVPSQHDVLAHPNVKVFFTHGGGNGFNEGVYFGKPLVVRPLWVDCFDQAVRGRDFGISLTLDRPQDFDVDDAVDKLQRVLNNPSFREKAERLGALQRAAGGRESAADLILGLPALA
ncbi:glycosyltransferase [Streptomyces albireticuli]|uniref:MGT family glycosyltransferase n=1 Tax=Streptomyces albireticuli TaxID=1940 RepID=A0A2A2D4X5_9ACTN|nr:glycosyltransferase [Streptomyces albireticuli]MCD9194696.1 glycosyltransferase [Streptomyces albireticuli]PAU46380.1 MGT family glycosyltransferase [Streptomyces albireticuli]